MFAHKVIESLNKQLLSRSVTTEVQEHYHSLCKSAVHEIKSSFKFHIDQFIDTMETFSNLEGSRLFVDHAEYLRMPYKAIWLDYSMEGFDGPVLPGEVRVVKRGILVLEHKPKYLLVQTFVYYPKVSEWVLSPCAYEIMIGEISGEGGNIRQIPHIHAQELNLSTMAEEDATELQALRNFMLLINCKNIEGVSVQPPKRLNKKRKKKGKIPIFTYKVLTVVIPKRKSKGGTSSMDWDVRLHFCRGHFKVFTKEKPLFGRHTGLYWWQPHVRGNKDSGVVLKDYRLDVKG